jgi:hypothetical protein
MDDVIAVIDGRPAIETEVEAASPEIRDFLAREFARLLTNEAFVESLPGHLQGDSAGQARLPGLKARLYSLSRTIPQQTT